MSNNINEFPIDDKLKELVTNLVANAMERAGIQLNANAITWFKNECAEELIANVLDSIIIWEREKLN